MNKIIKFRMLPSDWRNAAFSGRGGKCLTFFKNMLKSAPAGHTGNVYVHVDKDLNTILFIQNRQVALVSDAGEGELVVWSESEAERIYQESRFARRIAAAKYAALRQEFLDLVDLGGDLSKCGWVYQDGQEGGTFRKSLTNEVIGAGRIIARLGYNPLEREGPRRQQRHWLPRTRDRKRPPRDLRMTA